MKITGKSLALIVAVMSENDAGKSMRFHRLGKQRQPRGAILCGDVFGTGLDSRFNLRTGFDRAGQIQTCREIADKCCIFRALAVSRFVIEMDDVKR